jgi:hypothetical protein
LETELLWFNSDRRAKGDIVEVGPVDQGILTEEEFAAKKAKILGI